jgi:hypothetical protein
VRLHGGSTWHGCAWLRCDGRGAQVRKLKDLHKFDCLRANKSTSAFGLEALHRPQTNTQTTAWDAAVTLCSQRRSPRRLQHCRRAMVCSGPHLDSAFDRNPRCDALRCHWRRRVAAVPHHTLHAVLWCGVAQARTPFLDRQFLDLVSPPLRSAPHRAAPRRCAAQRQPRGCRRAPCCNLGGRGSAAVDAQNVPYGSECSTRKHSVCCMQVSACDTCATRVQHATCRR